MKSVIGGGGVVVAVAVLVVVVVVVVLLVVLEVLVTVVVVVVVVVRAPENLKLAGNGPKLAAMCGLQEYQKSHIIVVYTYYFGFYVSFLGF